MHTYSWLVWTTAALITISVTRNPLYLILILFVLQIVYLLIAEQGNEEQLFVNPLKFTLFVVITTAIFNIFTNHFGETILFTVPGKIPLLSGVVTLEAFVYGLTNGLILSGMLTTFSVLNLALPMRSLIHLIPRAFYPIAIITSIAITFAPETRRQLNQVREAQAVRGFRARSIKDWLPLAMPLLIGGLERSIQVAETMTARGFASTDDVHIPFIYRLSILGGLLILIAGWIVSVTSSYYYLTFGLLTLGSAGVIIAFWWIGKQTPRSSYKKESWNISDFFIILFSLLALMPFVWDIPGISGETLYYVPYPRLSVPPFEPITGTLILGLLAPAIIFLFMKTYTKERST
jgi:energy-coupling factor transport system permease protein